MPQTGCVLVYLLGAGSGRDGHRGVPKVELQHPVAQINAKDQEHGVRDGYQADRVKELLRVLQERQRCAPGRAGPFGSGPDGRARRRTHAPE
jgi:hypothetical protein